MEDSVKISSLGAYTVYAYPMLASTNVTAAERVDLGDKTVVSAYRQTAGKGQVGNSWESQPGKNLSFSVIFKPQKFQAADQFNVSMVVALGCRRFVARFVEGCSVKWPNDIYVGDKKIAGILIEHTVVGAWIAKTIAGVGLNVNQEEFFSDAPNPISLFQLTGKSYSLEEMLRLLLADIDFYLNRLQESSYLKSELMAVLYRGSGVYRWKEESGEEFDAQIVDINHYGQMVLQNQAGIRKEYAFKQVAYL